MTLLVAYWPQKPGGRVYLLERGSYSQHDFDGPPSKFIASIRTALGHDVDVWYSDTPAPAADSITAPYDQSDRPRVNASLGGRTIAMNWIQGSDDSFTVDGHIEVPSGSAEPQ